jgi:hypothetical protein
MGLDTAVPRSQQNSLIEYQQACYNRPSQHGSNRCIALAGGINGDWFCADFDESNLLYTLRNPQQPMDLTVTAYGLHVLRL